MAFMYHSMGYWLSTMLSMLALLEEVPPERPMWPDDLIGEVGGVPTPPADRKVPLYGVLEP